ncbi:MAG TPA: response regulator transcription factor [Inquilinus sp.]
MIAYRALKPIPTSTGGEDEMMVPDPIHRVDDRLTDRAAVAAIAPTPSQGDRPLISIIDCRALSRDSLTRALDQVHCGFRSQGFACLSDWLQSDQVHNDTAAVLLSIGTTDADDPNLAEDLQLLVREFGHVAVIVMGDIEDPSHVLKILGHGARGYIPTSVSLSVAVQAISLARAGGLFVPASSLMQSQQMPSEGSQASSSAGHLLTERQAAVAKAVSQGKANKIIAYELNLCESTVKVHLRSIMKKLQARNRTEVAFKLHNLAPRRAGIAKAWPSAMRA